MEHEFSFAAVVRKNRTTFSGVPLLRGIFRWNDPKSRVPFTFQPDFPETFCKLWTNPFFHANQCEKKYGYRKLFCQPTWLPCGCKTRVEGFALFVWLLTAYNDSCLSYGRAYEWFPFFKGPMISISWHQSNSKNNATVLLCKTILRHSNGFRPSVATDGKEWTWKLGQLFGILCEVKVLGKAQNWPKTAVSLWHL